MLHLDLFSGIGGFALACQWAGIETIGFVEIDKFCQKVLKKHWPSVPVVEDIRNVEEIKQIVANATVKRLHNEENECELEGARSNKLYTWQPRSLLLTGERAEPTNDKSPAILVTAGFPCQPFSVAGKRQGERDDRYLWPETLTVIEAIKPHWVLLENVTGIINLALDTVLSDLEGADYSTETLIIPACAVNAWHRRDRIWIIAHYEGEPNRRYKRKSSKRQIQQSRIGIEQTDVAFPKGRESRQQTEQERWEGSGRGSQEDVTDTAGKGLQRQWAEHKLREVSTEAEAAGCNWWTVEPELGRVAYGIPNRVDRLKCLGNAIVPQAAYEIIKVIKEANLRSYT